MRQFDASGFIFLASRLERIKQQIGDAGKVRVKRDWKGTVEGYLRRCSEYGLRVSFDFARNIAMWFDATSVVDAKSLKADIEKLQEATLSELSSHLFVYIPREKLHFFEAKSLFGDDVEIKFPSAKADIAEAGRCLALDRNPASVFHVMRVAEAGLRVIARKLQVAYARRSWGEILRDIDEKLNARPPQDPLKNQTSEAYRYLKDIKGLWRDTTMHVGEDYSPERAEYIFSSARAFMQGLAEKGLSEESA